MGQQVLSTGFSIGGLLVFGTTTSLIAKIGAEVIDAFATTVCLPDFFSAGQL